MAAVWDRSIGSSFELWHAGCPEVHDQCKKTLPGGGALGFEFIFKWGGGEGFWCMCVGGGVRRSPHPTCRMGEIVHTFLDPRWGGRYSLYTTCCHIAIHSLFASWYNFSSSQPGFSSASLADTPLCSRRKIVCKLIRPGCSAARASPVRPHFSCGWIDMACVDYYDKKIHIFGIISVNALTTLKWSTMICSFVTLGKWAEYQNYY